MIQVVCAGDDRWATAEYGMGRGGEQGVVGGGGEGWHWSAWEF